MNLRDPDAMNGILSRVLRFGVLIAAAILIFGTALLIANYSSANSSDFVTYTPNQIPHSSVVVSLSAIPQGIATLDPFAIIELGVIVLLATPVSRVLCSIFLFAAERDTAYVKITLVVLILLLFSIIVTPFIPIFNA